MAGPVPAMRLNGLLIEIAEIARCRTWQRKESRFVNAWPTLLVLLALNCLAHVRIRLEADKLVDRVALGMTWHERLLMSGNATDQIVADAQPGCLAGTAREDIESYCFTRVDILAGMAGTSRHDRGA